jgi:hypothetical protein
MGSFLQLVLVVAVTALATVLGTFLAFRQLQDRDERRRGEAAGRLVYLELSRNYHWVREFRNGHKTSRSLPFLTTGTWDAVEVDVARILDRRLIGKVVLPYFWIGTLKRSSTEWDILTKGYAKLAGYERQWFDEMERALSEATDVLGPIVWDKEQLERMRTALHE